MLKRLRNTLHRALFKRSVALPDLELRCRADVDRMARDLDLDQLARDAARHGLPAAAATQPDDAERKVHAYIHKRMSDLTDIVNEKLARYNTSIENTDINAEQRRIENITENTKLRIQGLMSEADHSLRLLKSEKDRYAAFLGRFKRDHQRPVEADYPDSRLLHFSILVVMLLLESMVNGYFFAIGSQFGWLGGISQSIIIAILNIFPAFAFAGLVLMRYLHHVSWWRRGTAFLVLLAYLAWVVAFNLAVAHYRDFLAGQPEQAVTLAMERLLATPLALSDLNSWLLFCMGILFSVIAAYDGYKSDDPYPGYGAKQRRLYDMEELFQTECTRLGDQVANIREGFLEELGSLADQVRESYPHLFHLAEQKRALAERHRHCMDDLLAAGDALMHKYRQVNRMVRNTPVPPYFDAKWEPDREYKVLGVYDDSEKIAEQKRLYQDFPAFVQAKANDIERIYAGFFRTLQDIEPGLQLRPQRELREDIRQD